MAIYDRFIRGREWRRKNALKALEGRPLSKWSDFLTNKLLGKLRKGLKLSGGPGMVADYVLGKVVDGATGDYTKVPKYAAFLNEKELEGLYERMDKESEAEYEEVFTRGIKDSISKFAQANNLSTEPMKDENGKVVGPSEAEQIFYQEMKNPKNWVGFLTGKDFDMLGADKIKEGEGIYAEADEILIDRPEPIINRMLTKLFPGEEDEEIIDLEEDEEWDRRN